MSLEETKNQIQSYAEIEIREFTSEQIQAFTPQQIPMFNVWSYGQKPI